VRRACPACDTVYFPDPKVAAAVLVERGGQVLLVRRTMEPEQGKWSLPAGFVDAEDDPREAALRECLEETGLEVVITGLFDVLYGREHIRGAGIFLVYTAQIIGGELQAQDDADAAAFFDPAALPPLAFSTTQAILDKWRFSRQPALGGPG
jgi:ADP-ribose pyrophosphatase YjhB (NUDIX family)